MNIREVAADIKTYQRLNRAAGSGGSVAAAAGGLEVTADTPREERQRQYGLKGPALQAEASGMLLSLQRPIAGPRPEPKALHLAYLPASSGRLGPSRMPTSPPPGWPRLAPLLSQLLAPRCLQVLYTLPSAPAMAPDLAQSLAAFCFPHGVRPELLERTPSMSGRSLLCWQRLAVLAALGSAWQCLAVLGNAGSAGGRLLTHLLTQRRPARVHGQGMVRHAASKPLGAAPASLELGPASTVWLTWPLATR